MKILDKILKLAHYILSKVIKPDMIIDKVSQLNEKKLKIYVAQKTKY